MEYKFKSGKVIHIEVDYDEYGMFNPRTECDNLGTIITTDNRYFTGDEIIGNNWTERGRDIVIEGGVVLPIMAYVHTGVTVWHSDFENRYCDQFDSGVIGFSYVTAEDLAREYPELTKEERIERGKQLLDIELKTYDNYLNYGTYSYRLEDTEGNDVDMCSGFEYNENPSEILEEMFSYISDGNLTEDEKEELKTYVKENCDYFLD